MHVIIVGCGVIGVTAAWYLVRAGARVTVLERRDGPALETSFANGSMLTPSLSAPWNAPGVLLKLIRYLGRKEAALLLRPAAFPGIIPWGLRFCATAAPPATRPILRKT